MKARGKREAKRTRRPWLRDPKRGQGLKGRNNAARITPFQGSNGCCCIIQGRRVPLRFTLAPGFHISRLWRWVAKLNLFNTTIYGWIQVAGYATASVGDK